MTTSLRTVLRWLDEQSIDTQAECWVLSNSLVVPVTGITSDPLLGDLELETSAVGDITTPLPIPLTFGVVYDTMLGSYSGGGCLRWFGKPRFIYRGSYVVNPENAVFFLFLPPESELVEDHRTKLETKKQQAETLEKELKENGRSS